MASPGVFAVGRISGGSVFLRLRDRIRAGRLAGGVVVWILEVVR